MLIERKKKKVYISRVNQIENDFTIENEEVAQSSGQLKKSCRGKERKKKKFEG